MNEMRVYLDIVKLGKGDIDSLKRFLYTNSGVREDGYKLISMHQDSEKSLVLDVIASTLDLLEEYSDENEASMIVKCIYEDSSAKEYSIFR